MAVKNYVYMLYKIHTRRFEIFLQISSLILNDVVWPEATRRKQ